jgi:1-deoxy-D-xylulose-5-phosphate synthase
MPRLLDGINGPADLSKLSTEQIISLAEEIRQDLVASVTNSGGHLASNLGVVELTIALHRVFQSPRDKIVWDVGHQSYVHKLLTGRRSRFATLRQYKGLSGYTDRSESEHDPFGSGHASTSISAALGIALGRDLRHEEYSVIAVIGDGALTGGMAFEALNHAGQLGTRLIVVLNDNRMSISPTVGAMNNILNKVWLDERLEVAEARAERALGGWRIGDILLKMGRRAKHSFKGFVVPASVWEEFGFTYIGPLDGHDIVKLESALGQARDRKHKKPVFIHILTTKGKGFGPAEEDSVRYHGISNSNGAKSTVPTYSDVFAESLQRIMKDDPRVVVITAAMAEGNCLGSIAKTYPSRFFDVGICEEHATTLAAGLATQGFVPVLAIYSTFLQRAFDQLIHDVCLQNLPVVLAMDRAGIVGDDGKTHQGLFDLSYLGLIPNLVVSAPKDGIELSDLLYTAVQAGRPMAIRYPRSSSLTGAAKRPLRVVPVGKGELLKSGEHVALLAVGASVAPALEAAGKLAGAGVDATVINARYAKPLDAELILGACRPSGRVITIEENVLSGGFGSSVQQLIQRSGLVGVHVESIGIPDQYVEHGPQHVLRQRFGLDANGIAAMVLAAFPELAGTIHAGTSGRE